MKLQETLYRREGHKEYREGYNLIDWEIHDRYCGESDVLRQLEFEEIQAPEYIYDEARQE